MRHALPAARPEPAFCQKRPLAGCVAVSIAVVMRQISPARCQMGAAAL